ncbi:hypothetical protein NW762_011342 [Fusarium torreyae]|uniref:Uncharacterized protein n=1 Tax=Fusarium torreyae TaxID=1237075 RepID=A0A9W8VCD9_9HYPO|nr:hypothetical protein NW762_011342 [Fusarium torreyae]
MFFQTFSEAANEACDLKHRKLLFCEISEVEQAMRLGPDLPTVEEYVTNRMQTSAVYIICFFFEYGSDIMLPIEVLTDPDMPNATVWA